MYYFDYAATTPPCPEALDTVYRISRDIWGNPSSVHTMGLEASQILESSRKTLARALAVPENTVVFTSSGTESINLALRGLAAANRRTKTHMVTTALEHPAVYETLRALEPTGFSITQIHPDSDGRIDIESVCQAVQKDTLLVTAVQVCSETGAVLDMPRLYQAVKEKNPDCLIHIDGVQGFLKIPTEEMLYQGHLACDLYSLSGHKLHTPRGIGVLFLKHGIRLVPQVTGGGQERALRSGTEPVALAAALAAAVAAWKPIPPSLVCETAKALTSAIPDCVIIPPHDAPHILTAAIPGVPAEVLTRMLGDLGVYISAGSACGRGRRSPILTAMGLPHALADAAFRLSFSSLTDPATIAPAVDIIAQTAARLR